MDNRQSLRVNTVLDGSYRIVRVVGAGGFAITYEAEDIHLGTPGALKEYYPLDFGDRDSTKATAADFEAWLRQASELKGQVCARASASAKPAPSRRRRGAMRRTSEYRGRAPDAKPQGQAAGGTRAGSGGTCGGWMFYNTSCTDSAGRTCRQTPGGRRCE